MRIAIIGPICLMVLINSRTKGPETLYKSRDGCGTNGVTEKRRSRIIDETAGHERKGLLYKSIPESGSGI